MATAWEMQKQAATRFAQAAADFQAGLLDCVTYSEDTDTGRIVVTLEQVTLEHILRTTDPAAPMPYELVAKVAAPFEGRWVLHPSKSGTPATSYVSVEALADAYADKVHAEVSPFGGGCPNCGDDDGEPYEKVHCFIRDEIRDAYLAGLRAHA